MGCSVVKPQQGPTVNNGVDSDVTLTHSQLRDQGNGSTSVVPPAANAVGVPEAMIRQAFLAGTLVPDPRCPLNARQLYGLTKSWKAINRNMSITAINIFVRLFETNADLREYFNDIKHLNTSTELRESKLLEMHAMKVICTIDDVIANLDDMDYVITMLQLSAQFHFHRMRNFDPSYLWRIEKPFLMAVKEELGDRFTLSIETTYRSTIFFILNELTKELTRCQQQQQQQQQQTTNSLLYDGCIDSKSRVRCEEDTQVSQSGIERQAKSACMLRTNDAATDVTTKAQTTRQRSSVN